MIDRWADALGKKQCVAVLAIDLSKAFDCLNHDSIFSALSKLGIRQCPLLTDYLNDRKQFVFCNGIRSELEDILNGIPQGSILGPLLFILALSDIEKSINAYLHMFADDITSWVYGNDWDIMQIKLTEILRELFTYLAYKGLKINMTKCHLMILGKQFLNEKSKLSIQLFDKCIEEENDLKLLGLTIDNKLTFEKHIIDLVSKCNSNIQFLWRTSKDRNLHHRKLLANALVMSHLTYCDTVYHSFLSVKLTNLLNSVQYKLLRFIFAIRQGQRVSLHTLCERIDWLPLDKLRECKLITLIWRIHKNDNVPVYLQECIQKSGVRTRFASRAQAIYNEYGRNTINNIYCTKFITLPVNFSTITKREGFLKTLKEFLS